ncbi:hypothetical protein NUU61_009120 [Penicillium alfredii]|uniref:Stress response protein rds1p n=1 Tax=Penicillium alfredii TaxID=1506179 RepID=A0A9W9JX31_9EURO|nr:uncharacterized protein NUU61_009120 [Penicillium alfredii]KAJ5084541.1 hypothetical protein NUU61_009120 [Penicillium alfredii]
MALALPVLAHPGPASPSDAVPGQSSLFTTYPGKKTPLAPQYLKPIPATEKGPAGQDDLLFQNLLAAEWAIYSFYQLGVETFSSSDFAKKGYPNTTYQRITEMRDNEAGHVRIFQEQISKNSVKPGPCQYNFAKSVGKSPEAYLAFQVFLEVSSMAYLTGLIDQADLNISKSALMAIGQVESRHNAWALIDAWNTSPFSGPSDTVYPYANQILDSTNTFIVTGSCPSENPPYPYPNQHLPQLAFKKKGTTGKPGSTIEFVWKDKKPTFDKKEYFAVFYHGVHHISVPYNPKENRVEIPAEFDSGSSIIIVIIADTKDAPTEQSVVAGPLIILEQPGALTKQVNAV